MHQQATCYKPVFNGNNFQGKAQTRPVDEHAVGDDLAMSGLRLALHNRSRTNGNAAKFSLTEAQPRSNSLENHLSLDRTQISIPATTPVTRTHETLSYAT